jgi:hypothetical protein
VTLSTGGCEALTTKVQDSDHFLVATDVDCAVSRSQREE